MGSRGPQALPTPLKKALGTYREDRAAENQPATIGLPVCPRWMKDKADRKEFKRLVIELNNLGVVGSIDADELARYVVTRARWLGVVLAIREANSEIVEMHSKSGSYYQVSALHSAERSLADQLGRLAASFGMNPSARTRISVSPAERDAPGSSVLKFIGRTG